MYVWCEILWKTFRHLSLLLIRNDLIKLHFPFELAWVRISTRIDYHSSSSITVLENNSIGVEHVFEYVRKLHL